MARPTMSLTLLPATLRGRLTVSIVGVSVLLFILVFGVTSIATLEQARELTRADAVAHLDSIRQILELDARELDSFITSYALWDEFYAQTLELDSTFVDREFDPWLREQSGASLVLWTKLDGTVLFEYGDAEDVQAVLDLIETSEGRRQAGPMNLPTGSSIVGIQPVLGDPPAQEVGYIAVARPMDRTIASYRSPTHISESRIGTATVEPDSDWTELPAPDGFELAVGRFESRRDLRVRASIAGLDGSSAGSIEFLDRDPWSQVAGLDPYVIALGLGLVSLILGLVFGLLLASLIRKPIEHFVGYIQNQGYLAIEGLAFEEHLEVDSKLPSDFKRLGAVIQDVLIQLKVRQSELKRANDQTIAAEQAFRTVVNDSSEVKLLIVDGIVDIANPAAAECLGVPIGMLVKRPLTEVFEDVKIASEGGEPLDVDRLVASALKRPVTVRCEIADQGERWMLVMVSATSSTGSYLLTARNISEEHRLEEIRAEIVSLVSHDLRAPLTVMSGYLDLLERPLPEDKHAKAVSEMRAAAARMTTLLENLLDTARTERALQPARFEEVDLGDLAAQVAEATGVATHRSIKVRAKSGALVLGDIDRLRQALDNLVGNACKHTPASADVTIVVSTTSDSALIAVEDGGPGIPFGQHEAIFERYRQLDRDGTSSGIGIGLYIVRVIAESHGGSARAEDIEGGGARFVIDLPLAPGGHAAS